MPRSFAKLLTSIWRDADFVALPVSEQRLYMLLMSQQDLSACGALPLRFQRWARLAPDTDAEGIREPFAVLIEKRFIIADWGTEEALIRSFIRHDGGYVTPNIHKAIVTAIGNLESSALQTVAHAELAKAAGHKPCERDTSTHPETLGEGMVEQSSQQPPKATFEKQPAASSRAEPGSDDEGVSDLPEPAAAAIEILIAHRTINATEPISNPKRYARKIRMNLDLDERQALIAEAATGVSPEVIARRVFALSAWQTEIAQTHIHKQATA